jgi:hypothetical protein
MSTLCQLDPDLNYRGHLSQKLARLILPERAALMFANNAQVVGTKRRNLLEYVTSQQGIRR